MCNLIKMCVTRHLMIIENENKNNLNNFSSHLIFLYSFVVHLVQGKALISGSDCRKLQTDVLSVKIRHI